MNFLTYSFNAIFYLMKINPDLQNDTQNKISAFGEVTRQSTMSLEKVNILLKDQGLMEIINEIFDTLN